MPQFPFLTNLTFTRLRVTFEAIDEVVFHNYKGYSYHGTFGILLKEEVCTRNSRECKDCKNRLDCIYFKLYKGENLNLHAGKYPDPPHPYIISPFADGKTTYKKGDRFGFEFTIIGEYSDQLPLLYSVFWQMGKKGIGVNRGRFKPIEIKLLDLSEGNNIPLVIEKKIRLKFETPLQLGKEEFLLNNPPSFELLINRLALRFSLLSHFQFGGDYVEPDYRINEIALSPASDAIYKNWGNSKNGTMKFDGLVGNVMYEGEGLQNWLPLLILGSYLHIGSKTTCGLGKYSIEAY